MASPYAGRNRFNVMRYIPARWIEIALSIFGPTCMFPLSFTSNSVFISYDYSELERCCEI
jgi:hypothetical protein